MKYSCSSANFRREFYAKIKDNFDFMRQAARAFAEAIDKKLSENCDVLFVCGGGVFGGIGFLAAEMLRAKRTDVTVLCLSRELSKECETARENYTGEILGQIPKRRYFLIADCLTCDGSVPEGVLHLIEFINSSAEFVISCDLPSGLMENGVVYLSCVRANQTVALGTLKDEYFLADGKDVTGEISLVEVEGIQGQQTEIWENEDVASFFPKKRSHVNKGNFGSASIFAGDPEYSGAVFLAAEACLRSGAGYTKIQADENFFANAVGRLPSAILKKYQYDEIEDMLVSDAISMGSGAGVSEELYDTIRRVLSVYDGTLVLDADALNAIAFYGTCILREKSCRVIITPHIKEFSRLIQRDVKDVLKNAAKYAQEFAREYDVLVVLKNNGTIVTDGKRIAINPTGSPVLAKGGSGDVLCGFLLGTCARGLQPFDAACVSCYLLGRAGELAARDMGEYAPCASDILSYLPKAMLSVGCSKT